MYQYVCTYVQVCTSMYVHVCKYVCTRVCTYFSLAFLSPSLLPSLPSPPSSLPSPPSVSTLPQARSPSPDDFNTPPQPNMMSPMSPLFRPLQDCLQHLQVPRTNITYKNMLGEGAFGEVGVACDWVWNVTGSCDWIMWQIRTRNSCWSFSLK